MIPSGRSPSLSARRVGRAVRGEGERRLAEAMTYNSLVSDTEVYADRHDSQFVDQIPRFVMLAENRLASEGRGLGNLKAVVDTFVAGNPVVAKPQRWRETISWNFGLTNSADALRNFLLPREYGFCRVYAPPGTLGSPKYYADYDANNWLVVLTPLLAYPFELLYYERWEPLDATHQTNWLTINAPQLLLYATLLEAAPFLKNYKEQAQTWQAAYDRSMAIVFGREEGRRAMVGDKTQQVQG